ncbi:MAG TPA: hypothetical protein VKB76_20055 [Ktedonobacterales bacterium]|nr:hypothetical protein [Ktedonobacterales bacterium]
MQTPSSEGDPRETVIALAGRRIDAQDATTSRFPLGQAQMVREQLRLFFKRHRVRAVVASGACGADLLALEVAGEARLQRKMVLPFARARFRELSVVDRPGDWGKLFDRICSEVKGEAGIKTLGTTHDQMRDFVRTNQFIIKEALHLAGNTRVANGTAPVLAVLVWDGKSRGDDDVTAAFGELAKANNIPLQEILTRSS